MGLRVCEILSMGGGMGFGGWSRFRRWVKNLVYTAVWPIVRSRIFVKLKSIVSKCIVPVSWCGIGAAVGGGAAFALGKYTVFSFGRISTLII